MTIETSQEPQDQLPEWVAKVRAIGVDTNAVGKGGYNEVQLRDLARQAEQHGGLELWIAEPVVWEWADHLREDRAKFNQARSNLKSAGIDLDAQPTGIEDALKFVQDGITSLGQRVKIVSIEPVALEALKDQILVRSPGERITRDGRAVKTHKDKSVKTGAADSAIYRAYYHQAKEKPDAYVILSGDSDVSKAHKNWGISDVKVFAQRDALNDDIFRMIQAPDALVRSCATFLNANLKQLDLTSFNSRTNLGGWNLEEKTISFAAIGKKTLVGLSRPKLDKKSQLVTAEACIVTDILGPEVTYDMYQDGHEEAGTQRTYRDSAVYVGVTYLVDKGAVQSLSMGAVRFTSIVETVEEGWDDDGPLAILESLVDVPGLENFEWAEGFYEDTAKQTEVDGDKLHLEFNGSASQDWTLTATYRGEQVQVFAVQQYDGMDLGEGHVIPGSLRFATDSKLVPNYPSLAVNALVMNTPKPN
ncbi:hypothetical protein ACFVVC_18420 [Pseudarthrobacter sp. NPDC058196]|uniref:hypothetical protein n=1 Tax=Pseudarthrobacter sp. NPDC058196 TaxID=3346376 RepID=UPI0036DCC84D